MRKRFTFAFGVAAVAVLAALGVVYDERTDRSVSSTLAATDREGTSNACVPDQKTDQDDIYFLSCGGVY